MMTHSMQTIYFSHPIYTTGLKLDFFCLTKADYIRLYVVYVATFLKDTKIDTFSAFYWLIPK